MIVSGSTGFVRSKYAKRRRESQVPPFCDFPGLSVCNILYSWLVCSGDSITMGVTMDTESYNTKRLYKSRRNRMIDGVCGGISEYLGIDPTIVRILWVLSIFIGGSGILAYIAAMIIMPVNPEHTGSGPVNTAVRSSVSTHRFWGLMFVILGLCILLTNLGVFAFFHFWHVSWMVLFAILLIICGLFLVIRSHTGTGEQSASDGTTDPSQGIRRLKKSRSEKKILGVCGGIAKYFNIDPSIVRVLYVFFILVTHGFGIIVYFALALILPEEELQHVSS
jgi:phage shock protein C